MVYLHIPFCKSFCTYCAFYSELFSPELASRYEAAVKAEIHSRQQEIRSTLSIPTLYLGGGTPSVLPPAVLQRIVETVAEVTGGKYQEFTMELNPDDVTPDYAVFLKALGVTRVSMGIQSFDADVLARMHRRHTAEGARRAFLCLREAGFENISVDLIYGVGCPVGAGHDARHGRSSLGADLDALLSLPGGPPEHISAYQLSIEEGSLLYDRVSQGYYAECPEEEAEQQYHTVCARLREAGYEHYEISNFAAMAGPSGPAGSSPYRAVHNSAYWTGAPYVGLGPAAHSYDGERRSWNPSDTEAYIRHQTGLSDDGRPGSELLTPSQRAMERVMLSLRTSDGIPEAELRRLSGDTRVDALLRRAYLEKSRINANLRIPEQHGFISDTIIAELV
ncbi:MAG: coproporphyrinogen III oxidase family protein [Bacteroidales bacterium]|nr:coproporphyrinogen III oxidase family protein [Bacteroidales bacterium]